MISFNRLSQAKERLEQDLKRIYDSVYESHMSFVLEICDPSSEENIYINKTEEELIDYLIVVHNPELNDEEIKAFKEEIKDNLKDSLYWSSLMRLLSSLREYQRYVSVFPQMSAACLALSYALIVHPILFSNWRWKDIDDIDLSRLDLNLTSKDIYGELQKCNPDVVSVFISKLGDCSQADKEILQDAFEGGQRDVFIEKLKALSTADYNSLALVTSFSHFGNVLISGDLDTLEILLYHIDFLEDFKPDLSLLPSEEWMEIRNEAYWEKYSFEDDVPEEEAVAKMDAMREKMESYLAMVRRVCFAYLKYKIPGALSSINPFPFERKYLDDVLNDPGVKSILDELPEKPFESEMAPDEQEQPEVKVVALPGGETDSQKQGGTPQKQEDPLTFSLPRGDEWKKCPTYKISDEQHYEETILGRSRAIAPEQVESLFNALVEVESLDNEEKVLLALAVRLTGRKLMVEPIPLIEWKGKKAELDYLIFRLTPEDQKPAFAISKNFFEEYDPKGASRRVNKGEVRPAFINELDKILPPKVRPNY